MPSRGVLHPVGPFSPALTLLCGQAFRWREDGEGAWAGVAGGTAWRLTRDGGVLRWSCGAERVRGEAPGPWLERYLGLRETPPDPAAEWAVAPGDLLDRALRSLPGLRILRQEPFECAVSYLFAQGLSVAVISRAVEKLCRAFGASLPPPPGAPPAAFHDFPSPSTLAALDPDGFRPYANNYRARGERVLRLASAVDSGLIDLSRLSRAPLHEAREALMGLEGIGPKIADCILLFSLGQNAAFPLDRWVLRALREHGSFKKPLRGYHGALGLRRYLALSEAARQKFGERCGWAGEYLFLYLRVREEDRLRRRLGVALAD